MSACKWPYCDCPVSVIQGPSSCNRALESELAALRVELQDERQRRKQAEEKVARNAEHVSGVVVLERERRVQAEAALEAALAVTPVTTDTNAVSAGHEPHYEAALQDAREALREADNLLGEWFCMAAVSGGGYGGDLKRRTQKYLQADHARAVPVEGGTDG